ncbi:MAG: DUF4012 domain-containing protein, partial [Candidatus Magasanikbacteria bacterium]|nr:DUF4012 domain-containing protein [Candidatus Magasanikbacteria bacterium]
TPLGGAMKKNKKTNPEEKPIKDNWGQFFNKISARTVLFKEHDYHVELDLPLDNPMFKPALSFPDILNRVRASISTASSTSAPKPTKPAKSEELFKPAPLTPAHKVPIASIFKDDEMVQRIFRPDVKKRQLPSFAAMANELRNQQIEIDSDPDQITDLIIDSAPEANFWQSPYQVDLRKIQQQKAQQLQKPQSRREMLQSALSTAVKALTNSQATQNYSQPKFSRSNPVARKVQKSFSSQPDLLSTFQPVARPMVTTAMASAMPTAHPLTDSGLSFSQTKPSRRISRSALSFAIISSLVCLPFLSMAYYKKFQSSDNGKIISQALAGLKETNLDSLELPQQPADFESVRTDINQTQDFLDTVSKEMPKYSSALTSGYYLFKAMEAVTQAGPSLKNGVKQIFVEDKAALTTKLRSLVNSLSESSPLISEASRNLSKVSLAVIPTSYKSQFGRVQDLFPLLEKSYQRLLNVSDSLLEMLGENEQKRYFVVFQNNSEIRPTGGFIGSVALMDIYQGKIRNLEIPQGGAYDFKGSLLARVISPQPLHLINPVWQLQDANWFFDWPTSAKKINWFYQKSGGPTVDGLIALNTFVLRDLLKVTGPIDLPSYGKVITAENFMAELQKSVEIEYKDISRPKEIIAELAPLVLKKIFALTGPEYLKVAEVLNIAADQKNIMVYLTDPRLQSKIATLGWGGEVKETGRDYLAVVDTNIGGQKTDSVIKESIRHQADVQSDGSVIDKVIIQRSHTGSKGTLFNGVRNNDYMRVYVPEGSQLLEATGFDSDLKYKFQTIPEDYLPDPLWAPIEESAKTDPASGSKVYNEGGKTVFANWLSLEPGQTRTVTIKYKLP